MKQPLLVLLLMMTCAADGDEIGSSASQLAELKKEIADAESAFAQSLKETGWGEATMQLGAAYKRKKQDGMASAMAIATADPQSEVAFDALAWVLTQDHQTTTAASAIKLLTKWHASNPQIGKALSRIGYFLQSAEALPYRPAGELLTAVLEKNPDRTARAQAAMGLARRAKWKADLADIRLASNRDRLAADATEAMQSVINEYGDCANLRELGAMPPKRTIADELKSDLYELQHLRVGKPAPEIEAEDLNGDRFRLSDARGRVVLLVFWATWCGNCMAAIPHELELVERFRDRPFVVIGVNGDEDKRDARNAVETHHIPWRSFWNGPAGSAGTISETWNVRGWPVTYVIDSNGIIRHKDLYDAELDAAIERLVVETEGKNALGT